MSLILEPQPGPQTEALTSEADVLIFGGAGGGGKTFTLLLEPIRHYDNPKMNGVIFRRTTPQITNPGGLWDEGVKQYVPLGAVPISSKNTFIFPMGMKIKFAHLEYEKNVYDWQGSQFSFLGWDELTHFTESQFFYMMSRLRGDAGVKGYVRATCNPDADSWVRTFIDWWIDPVTGYPIKERSGVLRWFIRLNDQMIWADTEQELKDKYNGCLPKSVTFIPSLLSDNKILMQKDPGYLANLMSLPYVERMRLLDGNWNIRPSAGNIFKKAWFQTVEAAPKVGKIIRYWDRAATEDMYGKNPDYTAGVKILKQPDGMIYVLDVVRGHWSSLKVEEIIKNTASQDGQECTIGIEVDPGQAGKAEANQYSRLLSGYNVKLCPVRADKIQRAGPVSAQSEAGNVKLVRGLWNKDFLDELESFPEGVKDDQVDGFSGAFNLSVTQSTGDFSKAMARPSTNPVTSSRGGMQW